MKKVMIKSGPAVDALVQVVPALQTFSALIDGEEAPLAKAPENVKDLTMEIITKMKKLVEELNKLVMAPKEEEKKEVKKEVKKEPTKK